MGEKKDKAEGRVKQAAGALTGNEELKKEGRRDEQAGKVKEKADEAVDAVKDKIEDVSKRIHKDGEG